jgi:hypothetical protein
LQWPEYYDNNPEKKEEILPMLGITPRQLYIDLSLALLKIHNDIWVHRLLTMYAETPILVITDVRQPQEVEKLRALGAFLIKVHRPGVSIYDDKLDAALADYKGWDYILENDGTLEQLKEKTHQLCDTILNDFRARCQAAGGFNGPQISPYPAPPTKTLEPEPPHMAG